MKTITVFSGSKHNIPLVYRQTSYDAIYMIACNKNKYKIAYGGGYTGIMGMVRDACLNVGCYCIGINCEKWRTKLDEELDENHYYKGICERQNKLVEIGDAYIVLPGGVGTFFEALQVITCNDIAEQNKPIFFLNTNNYFDEFKKLLEKGREENMIIKDNKTLNIHFVNTPSELCEAVIGLV